MKFLKDNAPIAADILAVATAVFMALSAWMVFNYAPMEEVMGWPQKIFYFHVPLAIMCYVGFLFTFIGSIGFLWKKDFVWDRVAVCGAETGVVFTILVLATGMFWGKPIWGAYWTWDPRLTTSLILLIIFSGYLILRSRVEDETLRAKYAAVMGIVGYADVPLVHYSVKLWSRGIHPVLEKKAGDPGMHPDMYMALKVCFVTFVLLFFLVFIQRLRLETLKDDVERLKTQR
ncbi:MAG: cytochrome c biogenesis protein CcsA [Nitrospinae bacterium]|nr:cytochrome c biogenesis protein CcsA [Nitrospinota bacterium]MBF0633290.1 cytochrome c biogenesis protein CcsA [Nitrospinota bacterium]